MPDTSLTDKVAVVTGSSRAGGIGRAICHALGREGCKVVVSDVGRPLSLVPDYPVAATEALDEAVEELHADGVDAIGVQCDVTNPDEVSALVGAAVEHFGRLDIFVNNAGIATESVELIHVSERGFTQTIDVNLKGTFLGMQAAARQLIAQGGGGRIINIASQAGKTGWPLLSAYSASKFGVLGLTQVAAKELGRHGITVNAVCPGTVNTPLNDTNDGIWSMYARYFGITADAVRAATLDQIPIGRFQEPEDVADLVVFLASAQGGYITGAAINTTGGQEMH
jgi:NAD(P)-dependent dehydrogenase (short-subunit alcohol dehydrogenase family)